MNFRDFAGMGTKMEQLMRSARAGRIVHALLFAGPHGTGKRTMAELFAKAMLCTAGEAEKPCGVCPACKRCESGTHPDIHYAEMDKNSIKVEAIRALIDRLGLAAYEDGRKIAIIEHADRMTVNAQNALLKTLESPTGDVLFFLLTDAPGAMLSTIVSRCLTVHFHCLEIPECAQVLHSRGMDPARAALLAAVAQGSVGRALEIDADEGYMKLRGQVIDSVENLKDMSDVLKGTSCFGELKGREADIFEILELWARDLMRVQNGAEPVEIQDRDRLMRSVNTGSALMQRVMQARREFDANVSLVNVLDQMDFDLAAGRA